MRQRGRPSAAALSIVPINAEQRRLQPPAHLNQQERALFQQVVNGNDPAHFAPTDGILLCSFSKQPS
jgi:hypothetical protein